MGTEAGGTKQAGGKEMMRGILCMNLPSCRLLPHAIETPSKPNSFARSLIMSPWYSYYFEY